MNIKNEWLAATPYLLTLVLIINVHIIGLYDFSVAGINISLLSLAPLVIFYLLQMRNQDQLVQHHIVASLGNLFMYLVLSSLYSGVMYMLGYHVSVIDPQLLAGANMNTWVVITPLIAIVLQTVFSSVRGFRLALKRLYPDVA
ncbi:MAG: hypothetical protein GQ470_03670 [Gammaproteobacteria bacterium]|nr:hypothetical protein [Gammaproteobacteria bacterium]